LFEDWQKQIAMAGSVEKRLAQVTTGGDEVQMARGVESLQSRRHEEIVCSLIMRTM